MTFTELAEIAGKKRKTVEQAFYLKRFSIKKSDDVAAYLHLIHRRQEVREKQPWRQTAHLKSFQYRAEPRVGDVSAWLATPRRVGQMSLDPTKEKLLVSLVRSIFLASPKVYSVICMGDWLRGGAGLYFIAVFSEQAQGSAGERTKLIVSQMAESSGQDMRLMAVDMSALPATLEHESNASIRTQLTAGRVEYGWIGLPIV